MISTVESGGGEERFIKVSTSSGALPTIMHYSHQEKDVGHGNDEKKEDYSNSYFDKRVNSQERPCATQKERRRCSVQHSRFNSFSSFSSLFLLLLLLQTFKLQTASARTIYVYPVPKPGGSTTTSSHVIITPLSGSSMGPPGLNEKVTRSERDEQTFSLPTSIFASPLIPGVGTSSEIRRRNVITSLMSSSLPAPLPPSFLIMKDSENTKPVISTSSPITSNPEHHHSENQSESSSSFTKENAEKPLETLSLIDDSSESGPSLRKTPTSALNLIETGDERDRKNSRGIQDWREGGSILEADPSNPSAPLIALTFTGKVMEGESSGEGLKMPLQEFLQPGRLPEDTATQKGTGKLLEINKTQPLKENSGANLPGGGSFPRFSTELTTSTRGAPTHSSNSSPPTTPISTPTSWSAGEKADEKYSAASDAKFPGYFQTIPPTEQPQKSVILSTEDANPEIKFQKLPFLITPPVFDQPDRGSGFSVMDPLSILTMREHGL